MRSPFAIFRKHQKVLTVVLTGMAMFAFVILGAVQDPRSMPPGLIVIAVAAIVGGACWLAGLQSGKSSEYGMFGVLLGAVLGIAMNLAGGPQDVVLADSGNINANELTDLQHRRALANTFLQEAYYTSAGAGGEQSFVPQPQPFGFGSPDPGRDVVLGELLRREADRLGLSVTDSTVNEYIKSVFNGKITAPDMREIRNRLRVGESDLYGVLKDELLARITAQYLYGGMPLPPENYWEFYRQLNVKEDAAVVPLDVRLFVDESVEPPDSELQQLFAKYQKTFSNTTEDGQPDEGRPGFRQPRRVKLAYVEAAYTDIEKQVDPVTDAEVEAYYAENFKTVLPDLPANESDSGKPGEATNGPVLPGLTPETTPASDSLPPAEPGSSDTSSIEPIDKVETPSQESAPPEGSTTPETPAAEKPAAEGDANAPETSALPRQAPFQTVALFDEDPPAGSTPSDDKPVETPSGETTTTNEKPVETKAAEEKADVPAAGSDPASTDDKPSAPVEPQTEAPTADSGRPPAPPVSSSTDTAPPAEGSPVPSAPPGPRPLDDDLRSEIRDTLLRERTQARMDALTEEVLEYMSGTLALELYEPEGSSAHITPAQASEKLKTIAAERGLLYVETPLLSARGLQRSEEYPIGKAVDQKFMATTDVVNQVFSSGPAELFRAQKAVDPQTDSQFVYWKTEDVESFIPQDMSDPEIRSQVVDAWRLNQAREKAQTRAEEIAKQVRASDEELSAVLANETVTGKEGAPALTVLHPPPFSWLTKADPRLSPNPFNTPPPRLSEIPGIPGMIGSDFMKVAFNELQTGDVGIAHSFDKDYLYVVKVGDRLLGSTIQMQAFQERFLKEPLFGYAQFTDYGKLAMAKAGEYQTDWSRKLFEKHKVQWRELPRNEEPSANDGDRS